MTDEEAAKRLGENDSNKDGVLSFHEFADVMIKYREDRSKNLITVKINDDGTMSSVVESKGG